MHPFRPIPRGIRGYRTPRCSRCWLETSDCICSLLPTIQTRTRISIVMSWSESCRPSNTGRLANLVLDNSEVRLRGVPRRPFDPTGLVTPGRRTLLLFPDPEAEVLTRDYGQVDGLPITLVVPDGTWRQARKTCRREKTLKSLEAIKLPPGPPSIYQLRRAKRSDQLCTYESISRALGILEGPEVERRMIEPLRVAIERQLRARGKSVHPGGRRSYNSPPSRYQTMTQQ